MRGRTGPRATSLQRVDSVLWAQEADRVGDAGASCERARSVWERKPMCVEGVTE